MNTNTCKTLHRSLSFFSTCLVITLLVSCHPGRTYVNIHPDVSSKNLENLSLRKFDWMIHQSLDSLATIFHEDVRYIHSNGWVETKPEILENLRSGKLTYRNIKIDEIKAIVYGNTGTVVGKGLFSVSLENQPLDIQLLFTEVYVVTGKGWVCVSRHACKVL